MIKLTQSIINPSYTYLYNVLSKCAINISDILLTMAAFRVIYIVLFIRLK